MKGFSLSINMLVLMIIAVIVLIGVLGLYMGAWGPGSKGLTIEAAKSNACRQLINSGCDPNKLDTIQVGIDLNGDGDKTNDHLMDLCENEYGCSAGDTDCCLEVCGCS